GSLCRALLAGVGFGGFFFFFQAEDGIRDATVTGVQTCALPIWGGGARPEPTVAGAVGIGFAQAVAAVFRGVSRSGSTVCAALWRSEEGRVGKEWWCR